MHRLQILMDSCSTHNFLDSATTKKLGCDLRTIPPMQVAVADGSQLLCNAMCKGFSWRLHGEVYKTNVVIVPLGSCEMILGVQWLTTLGPILWDFEQLRMEFQYNGKI